MPPVHRGFAAIGLVHPSMADLGGALRAARCLGAQYAAAKFVQDRIPDEVRAHRFLPLVRLEDLQASLPLDAIPVAVGRGIEGAVPLHEFRHPIRAVYVFGRSADEPPGVEELAWCKAAVEPPEGLDLSTTVAVVLSDRDALRFKRRKGVVGTEDEAERSTS